MTSISIFNNRKKTNPNQFLEDAGFELIELDSVNKFYSYEYKEYEIVVDVEFGGGWSIGLYKYGEIHQKKVEASTKSVLIKKIKKIEDKFFEYESKKDKICLKK